MVNTRLKMRGIDHIPERNNNNKYNTLNYIVIMKKFGKKFKKNLHISYMTEKYHKSLS